MTLKNIHPTIDTCTTKQREFIPITVDKCLTKPEDCVRLVPVCVDGLLFLGSYGEWVNTNTCASKLLLTDVSFPPSCITCCGSDLICIYTSFQNTKFLADQ